MPDIVIDTNILVYLENEDYQYHSYCRGCIDYLYPSNYHICFDEGFHLDEAQNSSYVWHEITKHCPHGSEGYAFVLYLFDEERIKLVPKNVPTGIRQIIDQSGIKKSDRTFMKIAYNSESKMLISDEHEDFTNGRRNTFRKKLEVRVIHSWEVVEGMF